MYRKARLLTGVVQWEECLREGAVTLGNVLLLHADGMVWETVAERLLTGGTTYHSGHPKMRLTALVKDWGRDKDGLAATWRAMYLHRERGYEMLSPVQLEAVKAQA